MRKIKTYLVLLIGVSLMAATACNKDEDMDDNNNNNDTTPKTCYITTMDYGDNYDEVEYNSSNKVILQTNYDSTGTPSGYSSVFTYSSNLLVKMESIENGQTENKLEMVYTADDKIDTVHLYANTTGTLEKLGYFKYVYSGEKVASVSMYFEYMGTMLEVSKNEFTYTGDNVSLMTTYSMDMSTMSLSLESTTEYTYDDKKNPMIGIGLDNLMGEAMFMSKNNILTETVRDADGIVQNDASLNYSYTYSENDYPEVSTATTFDNSETEVTTYSYDCE